MSKELSRLLNQAMFEIESLPDIQSLNEDSQTQAMVDELPYNIMAEVELQKENSRCDIAAELVLKMQQGASELLANHEAIVEKIHPKLDHPLMPASDKKQFTKKLRQVGLDMVIGYYTSLGVSLQTAQALAEIQVK